MFIRDALEPGDTHHDSLRNSPQFLDFQKWWTISPAESRWDRVTWENPALGGHYETRVVSLDVVERQSGNLVFYQGLGRYSTLAKVGKTTPKAGPETILRF